MKNVFIVLSIFLFATTSAIGQKGMHIISNYPISGSGGWDYLAVGPVKDLLYVSHGTQVNILNRTTGDSVGIIPNTLGVHGIAFDTKNKKGFISNGRTNTVTVFDLNTNIRIVDIPVGANPDAILYDPYSKMIITCNGRSRNLSIIDPKTNMLMDSIYVGGKPETAVSNGKGKLYVNIEDKNEIVAIDMKKHVITDRWSLAPGEGPAGLAIDIKNNILFTGCEKLLIVLDANTGKIIDKIPIGEGCDGVAYDPSLKNIYCSNGEGTLTVIHEKNADKFSVVENVITKKSARTIALDEKTHRLFLSAAEFEPLAPGEKGRPRIKPGTFRVLVVCF